MKVRCGRLVLLVPHKILGLLQIPLLSRCDLLVELYLDGRGFFELFFRALIDSREGILGFDGCPLVPPPLDLCLVHLNHLLVLEVLLFACVWPD